MKRFLFLLIIPIILLSGCNPADMVSDSTCPYAVMADDVIYYYTGEVWENPKNVNNDDGTTTTTIYEVSVRGNITSVVPENQMPSQNGEANMDIMDAPYARIENGLIVNINDEWIIFEIR